MNTGQKQGTAGRLLAGLACAGLLLAAGGWGAGVATRAADADLRGGLLEQAVAIAHALDPALVRALSFTAADRDLPAFQRIRHYLRTYAEAAGLRSVYTMARRGDTIFFGPESLAENDPFASPPGTVYEQPSPADWTAFETARPASTGPQADEYGTFVSALAPVLDPLTGEVLLLVGVDVEARSWRARLAQARRFPLAMAGGLLGLLLVGLALLEWRDRGAGAGHGWLRHAETILIAALGLALTLAAVRLFRDEERRTREARFKTLARVQSSGIVDEWRDLRNRIEALAGFFEASERVTPAEFRAYVEPQIRSSLAQRWLWLRSVPAEAAADAEDGARREGMADFRIWQPDGAGGRAAAAGRDQFYPVVYVAPASNHLAALGYDMGSDPFYRVAIEEARRTGLAAASDPHPLMAAPGHPSGLAIFRSAKPARQEGLVAAAVSLDALTAFPRRRVTILDTPVVNGFFQLEPGRPPVCLSTSSPEHHAGPLCWASDFALRLPVFIFGKTYAIVAHPDPAWAGSDRIPGSGIVGVSGLLLTMLFAAFVGSRVRQQAQLEKEVRARTVALLEKTDELEKFFSSSLDLLCIADTEGRFRRLNREWEKTLGYPLAELEGRRFLDLVHPDDVNSTQQAVATLAQGEEILNFTNRYRCRDGSYRWIEWRSFPSGRLIYAAARDITEPRRIEQQLKDQLNELRRWQQAMLGREGRIAELKAEINELLARAGRPPRYAGSAGAKSGAGGERGAAS